MENTDVIDVKRAFVLDDVAGKPLLELENKLTINEFRERYYNAKKIIDRLNEYDLDEKIRKNDPGKGGETRIRRFNERIWREELVSLDKIGSYPEMRGLPIGATIGNFHDVAKYVEEHPECLKNHPNPDELKNPLESLLDSPESSKSLTLPSYS